jgi:hypothetical protein
MANKFISILFTASLLMLAVACGKKQDNQTSENAATENDVPDTEIAFEQETGGDDRQPEKVPSSINFSGLYYDLNTKQGYYIYWDKQKGEATSVYLSDAKGKWQKAAIRSQQPSAFFEYQEAEQTVEITYQNQPLKLIISKENEGAKTIAKFVSEVQQETTTMLADASVIPLTESQPLYQHIAEALAGMKWQIRDPKTFQGSASTDVSAVQQGNRVIFTLTEGSTKATFTCEVQTDNSIRCATEGFDDFSIKVKMTYGGNWELHFDAPTGEAIMTLISPK